MTLASKGACVALVALLVACSGPHVAPEPERTPLQQAVALRETGRLDEAEKRLQALAVEGDARAELELAETLMLRGKHAQAVALLKERYKINQDDADLAGIVARALDGAGKPDEAAPAYVKRLQLHPRDVPAALRLAELLVGRGDLVGACMVAEAALRMEPNHPGLHTALSRALLGRGRVPQALEHAKQAAQLAPEDASSWLQMAQVQILAGDLEAAKEALQKCLKIDSQHAEALRDLGVLMLELGDTKEAVALLKRATQVVPDSAVAWTALGVARHRQGDLVGAMASLEHACRLNPHAPAIYANLAEVALDDGFPRRAVTEARKARDHLGASATADLRQRIERLHTRAVVVALLADALCRNDKDGAALQQTAERELHDAGLDAYLPEIPKVGDQATVAVRAAHARCRSAAPPSDPRPPSP